MQCICHALKCTIAKSDVRRSPAGSPKREAFVVPGDGDIGNDQPFQRFGSRFMEVRYDPFDIVCLPDPSAKLAHNGRLGRPTRQHKAAGSSNWSPIPLVRQYKTTVNSGHCSPSPHLSSLSCSTKPFEFTSQYPVPLNYNHEVLQPARHFRSRRRPQRRRCHGPELRRGHHRHRVIHRDVLGPGHDRQQPERPELRDLWLRMYLPIKGRHLPRCSDVRCRRSPRGSATSPPPSPTSTASSL